MICLEFVIKKPFCHSGIEDDARLFDGIDGQAIMVDNRYKLLHRAMRDGGYELYDILEDPGETCDIKDKRPELFKKMKEQLDKHKESCINSYLGSDYPI